MALKLIREAQAIDRLGKHLSLAQTVQSILGAASITAVARMFEQFDEDQYQITPQDYQQWMEVLQAEAADRGANLDKKRDFEDLAFLMFENDPRIDELGLDDETLQKIVSTLWTSFKASRSHGAVQRGVKSAVARAREEEEMLAAGDGGGFADAVRTSQGVENEESSWRAKFKGGGKMNPYPQGSLRHNLWNDVNCRTTEDEEFGPGSSAADIEGAPGRGEHDVEFGGMADQITDRPNGGSVIGRIDDLEARIDQIEQSERDEPWHDAIDDVEQANTDIDQDQPAADATLDDVEVEDEEAAAKSMFHKVLTSPRDQVAAALKDIESEGRGAWAGMQLPKNPHPKKSQAYNAWAKSFKSAAKDALGIADKPSMPAKKRR